MARYISLIRFTEHGARAINKSTSRAAAFRTEAEKAGLTVEAQYWTAGAHDGVLIISADNEQKVLHCLTSLVAGGNVRTETLEAFDANQFDAITGNN